ncbi:hypothetical protein [Providencia alcalifaciens]|uniref:hypothetical protein n=1 Tax=Providencia alcalifaciens TaxID=126385 RepID=UPI0012BBCBA4|nr:hypothetical protein [Providencia alcalifaciens]
MNTIAWKAWAFSSNQPLPDGCEVNMGELSARGKEVLAGAIKLMDELKAERQQGIKSNRPSYYETGIIHRVKKQLFFESLNHPPLPDHIQKERDDKFREALHKANPDWANFDPYKDIPANPWGGRKVGD